MKAINEMLSAARLLVDMSDSNGFNGQIQMPRWKGSIIVSWGGGWEHVSVSPYKRSIIPSWDDMCYIKNMFWNEDECAVQYHPPKSEYVNNKPNCLHLWKPVGHNIEMPPSIMLGTRDGQSIKNALEEAKKLVKGV